MNRGIEITSQALDVLAIKQDILANNLANANTSGFKSDTVVLKSFPSLFIKALGEIKGGVGINEIGINEQQSALMPTGSKLDVALKGTGFFEVETPEGIRYSRNGNFTINSSGQMVTQDGYAVMGENGPITISGKDIMINLDGTIVVDGQQANKLKVVDFSKPYQLDKVGNNFFVPRTADVTPQEKPNDTEVIQGHLESSDVNVVKEMVKMIDIVRSFEYNQKALLAQSDMLSKSVREVGATK